MYSFWRLSCNGYRSFRRFSWVQIPPGNVYLTRYPATPPSKFLELRSLDRFSRGLLEMFRSYVSSENRFTIASTVKLYRYCLVRKEKWNRLAWMVVLVWKAGIFRQPWSPGAIRGVRTVPHIRLYISHILSSAYRLSFLWVSIIVEHAIQAVDRVANVIWERQNPERAGDVL